MRMRGNVTAAVGCALVLIEVRVRKEQLKDSCITGDT